jgi:hypothetical protein
VWWKTTDGDTWRRCSTSSAIVVAVRRVSFVAVSRVRNSKGLIVPFT